MKIMRKMVLALTTILLLSCNQLIDFKNQDQNITNTSDASSQNGSGTTFTPNTPQENPPAHLEDYLEYGNIEITEENLESALSAQPNKAQALHLMEILRNEIVPQATNALLQRFPRTFGHLKDQVIGMGLALNTNDSSTAMATFAMGYLYGDGSPYKTMDIRYTLTVNYSSFMWKKNKLQAFSRQELEVTIAHEMMHAFMCETLTRGFTGLDHNLSPLTIDKFPSWFIEGTAEAVCGAIDTIRRENGFGINQNTTLNEIQKKLSSDKFSLTSDNITATYKTGYLAVLYLSYLASGSKTLEATDLAQGLDQLLSLIHKGESLSNAIKKISKDKFSDLKNFEDNFAEKGAHFVKKLMEKIEGKGEKEEIGRGALLTGNYSDRDLLINEPLETQTTLFWLNISNYYYFNKYNDKFTTFDVLKGGSATQSGISGPRPYEKINRTSPIYPTV